MLFDLPRRIAHRARSNGRLMRWGRMLAITLVVLGGFDLFSTNAALAAGHIEGNLFVRSLQTAMGSAWAFPKMAFHLALAYLVLWMPSKRMLATGAVVSAGYMLLVLNNFYLAALPL